MNPRLKEIRERLAALAKRGTELLAKSRAGQLSDDELTEWNDAAAEVESLKAEKARLEAMEAQGNAFEQLNRDYNQPASASAARTVTPEQQAALDRGRQGGNGRMRALDFRPYGQRVAESAEYQVLRASGWRGNTGAIEVGGSFYHGRFAGEELQGPTPEEIYTLIQTSALPSSPAMIAPYRRPGIAIPDMPELNVRDAFVNLQTESNSIEFWRELLFTNAAAATAEGVAAPESALTWEATSVPVRRIAHYIPVTEIALDDEPRLRGLIDGRLMDGLRLVEDEELLEGDGSGEHLRGLLNVSGVQVLDDTHFAAEPVENDGNAWEDFDRIVRARREVRIVGRARANVVMYSPADFERLITITDQNGQYFSGSPFSDIAITRMRGLLVIEVEALDEGTAVVADGRQFEVYDRMAATVTAGYINDDFVKGRIALLATERLAFAPIRPAAAAIVTLTSA